MSRLPRATPAMPSSECRPKRLLQPSEPMRLALIWSTAAKVALLTLACPARRLYGRAFPPYFGPRQLAALAGRLTPHAAGETEPAAFWPDSW